MSPVASAARTVDSGTSLPRLTRSSYGLLASSGAWGSVPVSDMALPSVEGPVDDVHLLLAREPHEVDGITGDANGQARVLLGMVHRVEQHVAVQHVDVHVIPGAVEEGVEHAGQIGDAVFRHAAQALRDEAGGQRDPVCR